MAAFACSEVATGIDSFSASSTNSASARDHMTPPPARMIGRSAVASACSASRMRVGSATGRNGGTSPKRRSTLSAKGLSASEVPTASWPVWPRSSTWTGPGAPVVATRKAWATTSDNRSGFSTSAFHLVTGPNMSKSRISWYTWRYLVSGDVPPVNAITGLHDR